MHDAASTGDLGPPVIGGCNILPNDTPAGRTVDDGDTGFVIRLYQGNMEYAAFTGKIYEVTGYHFLYGDGLSFCGLGA